MKLEQSIRLPSTVNAYGGTGGRLHGDGGGIEGPGGVDEVLASRREKHFSLRICVAEQLTWRFDPTLVSIKAIEVSMYRTFQCRMDPLTWHYIQFSRRAWSMLKYDRPRSANPCRQW